MNHERTGENPGRTQQIQPQCAVSGQNTEGVYVVGRENKLRPTSWRRYSMSLGKRMLVHRSPGCWALVFLFCGLNAAAQPGEEQKEAEKPCCAGQGCFLPGFWGSVPLFKRHSQPESQSMQLITTWYITFNKLLGLPPPRGKLIGLLRFVWTTRLLVQSSARLATTPKHVPTTLFFHRRKVNYWLNTLFFLRWECE